MNINDYRETLLTINFSDTYRNPTNLVTIALRGLSRSD
jgi:hypothetical protein